MVEEKDVLIAAVGETKAAGDFSQGAGARFFVKADGGGVGSDYDVELDQTEAAVLVSMKAVPDPCFVQVFASSGRGNGVGGVCDMAAAADVVGMEDVEPRHLAGIGFGYGRAGFLKVRGSVWGKATPAATTSFRIAVMAGRLFPYRGGSS